MCECVSERVSEYVCACVRACVCVFYLFTQARFSGSYAADVGLRPMDELATGRVRIWRAIL